LWAEDYLPKPFNPVISSRFGLRPSGKEAAVIRSSKAFTGKAWKRKKSERLLLLNILLKAIAQRLKQGMYDGMGFR